MPSPTEHNPYTPHRTYLLDLARRAMIHGVRHGEPPPVPGDVPDPLLRELRATFITLERKGRLRGCIGRIEAVQPLVADITEHAVAAALHDPRFGPVQSFEIPEIQLSISILTPPEPMTIRNEDDLVRQLVPGEDGLILQEGHRRVTFLPSVWEELPDPQTFVQHLKLKAGWPATYWSSGIQAQRYRSFYLSEKA